MEWVLPPPVIEALVFSLRVSPSGAPLAPSCLTEHWETLRKKWREFLCFCDSLSAHSLKLCFFTSVWPFLFFFSPDAFLRPFIWQCYYLRLDLASECIGVLLVVFFDCLIIICWHFKKNKPFLFFWSSESLLSIVVGLVLQKEGVCASSPWIRASQVWRVQTWCILERPLLWAHLDQAAGIIRGVCSWESKQHLLLNLITPSTY